MPRPNSSSPHPNRTDFSGAMVMLPVVAFCLPLLGVHWFGSLYGKRTWNADPWTLLHHS
jgi:hypothetical protein